MFTREFFPFHQVGVPREIRLPDLSCETVQAQLPQYRNRDASLGDTFHAFELHVSTCLDCHKALLAVT